MGYIIKKLTLSDLENNSFLETLSNLRPIKHLPPAQAKNIFLNCENKGIEIYIALEESMVVGTIRVIFEPKFYHEGRYAAHIEDVATHKDHIGKGIAHLLINHVIELCRERNCYKIILDCDDKLVSFYKKFNFHSAGNFLRLDL